jgi:protein-S-isoprenylcysteine O-methyltransferase Ste14
MRRFLYFLYGVVCYAIFFVTFLYLVGFIGNLFVPKGIDDGTAGSAGLAVLVNVLLVGLFGLQHTVMARPGFKRSWTRIVPEPIERSTYVLLTSLLLMLLMWQWRPIPGVVWSVGGAGESVLRGLFFGGVGLVLYATFLIDHFDLFGLRQVFLYLRGREYRHPPFATPALYRMIRHPLYVGWFLTFWVTPEMTVGHLLFAITMSGCILVAMPFEERDLMDILGDPYRRYRASTPAFIPGLKGRRPRQPRTQKAY